MVNQINVQNKSNMSMLFTFIFMDCGMFGNSLWNVNIDVYFIRSVRILYHMI